MSKKPKGKSLRHLLARQHLGDFGGRGSKPSTGVTIRKTHHKEFGYDQHGPGLWRIIDRSTGAAIGPYYASKRELLEDLNRFAGERLGTPLDLDFIDGLDREECKKVISRVRKRLREM